MLQKDNRTEIVAIVGFKNFKIYHIKSYFSSRSLMIEVKHLDSQLFISTVISI
jgi:hypothetical protein